METLLKDGDSPDSSLYSLYWVLTLTTITYMDTLLKDRDRPNGSLIAYIGSSS